MIFKQLHLQGMFVLTTYCPPSVHQRRGRSLGGTGGPVSAPQPPTVPEEPALEVLVVSLNTPGACPGMVTEQKVSQSGLVWSWSRRSVDGGCPGMITEQKASHWSQGIGQRWSLSIRINAGRKMTPEVDAPLNPNKQTYKN